MALEPLAPLRLAPLAPVGAFTPAAVQPGLGGRDFAQALAQVRVASNPGADEGRVRVREGDTLIGLVKAHHRQAGVPISETQATRLAHHIAARNAIATPDLIHPGQVIDFSALELPPLAGRSPEPAWPSAQAWAAQRSAWGVGDPPVRGPVAALADPASAGALQGASAAAAVGASEGPGAGQVLERTIDRAVRKGFIPSHEAAAVRERIGQLAQTHGFSPDDFALVTLMESDGMNPQASNGRCHGIIQFCDGQGRGAASVGMAQSPRAILGMSVLQQLDLVDRYFEDTGLRQWAPNTRADDLYLTVLTPAARAEKRRHVPLDIAGVQAAYLYVGHDRSAGITRDSLLAGLHHNAGLRLGMDTRSAMLASRGAPALTPVAWQGPSR